MRNEGRNEERNERSAGFQAGWGRRFPNRLSGPTGNDPFTTAHILLIKECGKNPAFRLPVLIISFVKW